MELMAAYILEREGINTIERDYGFVTYTISGNECYLRDMYVRPEQRTNGYAWDLLYLVKEKAHEAKCTHISTTVIPSTFGSTNSLKAILAGGFKLHSASNDRIIFVLEL